MLPTIWGNYAWGFIHLVAINYPNTPTQIQKKYFKKFFSSIQNILPCDKCKYNMKKHLIKYPLSNKVLSSKKNLVKWTIDLHNVVNYYTGKEMLSYNEAINEINKIINLKQQSHYLTYFVLVLIVLLIIFAVYIKNRFKY